MKVQNLGFKVSTPKQDSRSKNDRQFHSADPLARKIAARNKAAYKRQRENDMYEFAH